MLRGYDIVNTTAYPSVARHEPNGGAIEAHKDVPLFLISNSSQACGDLVLLHDVAQLGNGFVIRIYGFRKGNVTPGVFVAVIDNRVLRERREVCEGVVHLLPGALKEPPASSNKERIASKHATGMGLVGCVNHMIADGVLGVAWSS